MSDLAAFVAESNRIEGIVREPTDDELSLHGVFLACPTLLLSNVEGFVNELVGAPLRTRLGMNVRVGQHIPPSGGPEIAEVLAEFVDAVNGKPADHPLGIPADLTPYAAHVFYERLHPFMDGNGRSGRAIWAWQMKQNGLDPFSLPFLHRFYYQALDASRSPDYTDIRVS